MGEIERPKDLDYEAELGNINALYALELEALIAKAIAEGRGGDHMRDILHGEVQR